MATGLLGKLYLSCHAAADSACGWAAERVLGASTPTDCVVDLAAVQQGMDVMSACGQPFGKVEHVYLFADRIYVRTMDGHTAFVPRGWVVRVTDKVRLRLNAVESRGEWAVSRAVCAA
jgi:hypothetical protein